jgi:glutathione-regulated potassium-efflux system ancillary protein KefF
MLCLVYAHPYPDRSRANRSLLEALPVDPRLDARSLYDLYPAFDIDVEREQAALGEASVVVLQHPLYWYSVPGLMKHYFDKVLVRGFAYGEGGRVLRGKRCLWVPTTGGDDASYAAAGPHGRPFAEFVAPIAQLALFCGMHFEEPFVVHAAHRLSDDALAERARAYRSRLLDLLGAA